MARSEKLAFRLPRELAAWLRDHCAAHNTTMSELLRTYLIRLKKKQGANHGDAPPSQ